MMVSQIEQYGEVIYKKDLFTSKGMEDPIDLFYKDQWTWDKMDEYAKKLPGQRFRSHQEYFRAVW